MLHASDETVTFADGRWVALHPRGEGGHFAPKQEAVTALVADADAAVARDVKDPAKAAHFRATLSGVLASLDAHSLGLVRERVAAWHFRETIPQMIDAHIGVGGINPIKEWHDGQPPHRAKVGAFVFARPDGRGEVYLGGGADTGEDYKNVTAHTYRHEISHVLDGVKEPFVSSSREWKHAWSAEIDTSDYLNPPISSQAWKDGREGFAEFGRLALTDRKAAMKFKLCWEVWKAHHLV